MNTDCPFATPTRICDTSLCRYMVAIFICATASGLAFWLPVAQGPWIVFLCSVVLSALYCGLGPAVLNVALAALMIRSCFIVPELRLDRWPADVEDTAALCLFSMLALVVACLVSGCRRANHDLLASEEWYRFLARTASDGIISLGEEDEILFVNSASESIFGYSTGQLVGRKFSTLIPVNSYAPHLSELKSRFDTRKRVTQYRMSGWDNSGQIIPLEVTFGAFLHHGKHVFTAVIREVGLRSESESDLHIEATQLPAISHSA
jgi:PAS domain S-box-containing protein